MSKTRVGLLFFLAFLTCLSQGCVELAISKISSDSTQLHSAYAGYFTHEIEMRAQQPVTNQSPILAIDKWSEDIYHPQIEYADYYQKNAHDGIIVGPLMPFEIWKQTEYKQLLEDRKKLNGSPNGRNK